MTHRVASSKLYLVILGALLALTLTTVLVSRLELGAFNFVVAMLIAVTKATLVVMFFMDVRRAASLTRLFVGAGLVWLSILLVFVVSDYVSRGWLLGPHWL